MLYFRPLPPSHPPSLTPLFLSSFNDMSCMSRCMTLSELTLDGNPLANSPDHRPSIIYHVRCLGSLDQRPISVSWNLSMEEDCSQYTAC